MTHFARCTAILAALFSAGAAAAVESSCVPTGRWLQPGAVQPLQPPALFGMLAQRRVVLLGERHDNAGHHRWQLQVLAALQALHPQLVLGFESFPRRVQPALDRWVSGDLSEAQFLAAADWRNVWGFDPELYLPLFRFARMNGVPMLALNVDKELTRAIREKGFDAVDIAKREGVTRPAPPPQAYLDALFPVFAEHEKERLKGKQNPSRKSAEFARFVESQTTWDRAMAQAIAQALVARPGALAVGIMGREHVANGYGVPHQLAELGVRDAAVLLPWDADARCERLVAGLADAVFGIAASAEAPLRPRLGVRLEAADDGVKIAAVSKDSVAQAAGLRDGDLVVEVAGRPAKLAADLAEAVARQSPGTWLPIRVKRDGALLDLVAKFPPVAN